MAFANGIFSRLYSWVSDRDGGVKIRADRMDAEMDGFKDAFNAITAGTVSMIGPIKGYDGTVSAPGYGFDADTNSGMYRIGADNIGVTLGGVKLLDMSTGQLQVTSADAGATVGPILDLYRNSATPANADILGKVLFNGEDSAGNTQEFASIETVIVDVTSTSEDGQLDFYVTKAGTRTKFASMTATATAFTGAAAYSFDRPLTVSSNASGDALVVESTDAGAAVGPVLNLYRNSATPANADLIGRISFNGKDDAGNDTNFGAIVSRIEDATNGSEDSSLAFGITNAGGQNTSTFYIGRNAAGTSAPDALGVPKGQISYPATQNPSTDPNTNDDYREFDWTPVLTFATPGTLSLTYTTQLGRGEKNGKKVTLWFQIVTSSFTLGTASGNLQITGNPYTSNGTLESLGGGLEWSGVTKAGYTDMMPRIGVSASVILIRASGSGVVRNFVTASDTPSGGSVVLEGFVTFEAAA
jgi:hypothetical protein